MMSDLHYLELTELARRIHAREISAVEATTAQLARIEKLDGQLKSYGAPAQTGKELVVQVHYDEGVAIHIGPEPCVGTREGDGEASAGERIGQPLSRENLKLPGADVFVITEGNTDGRVNASVCPTRRGRRTWHVRKLFVWEPGGLGIGL